MNDITQVAITAGVVLVVLLGIVFGIPYLKAKKVINETNIDVVEKAIHMGNTILHALPNSPAKNGVQVVLDVADKVTKYVEQTMKQEDNTVKKQTAKDIAETILTKVGVNVDEGIKQIIEVGIESAVSELPKTNKQL